jgi:hypothetical protein
MSGDFLKSDGITVANRSGRDKWQFAAPNAYQRVVAALSMISRKRYAFVARENRCPLFRIML